MSADLCKKSLEKVGNPNVLINMLSRCVRQLNSGAGGHSVSLEDQTRVKAQTTCKP